MWPRCFTWLQAGHWKNSIALFTHTLNATADNYVAHNYLGLALAEEERREEAMSHYCEAVRIKPSFAEAHINLGKGYFGQGDVDGAIAEFRRAILLTPRSPEAHYNLGIAYGSKGLYREAFQEIRMAKALSSKGKWDLIRREMKTTPSQHAPH